MYYRYLEKNLKAHYNKYKEILILLGSRQSGKTTLLKRVFNQANYLLVDNEPIKKMLETYDINAYLNLIKKNNKEIIIDEIHLLSDPGRAAKIIYDSLENIKLILTGSSSFHIKNKTSESLAGRKIDYHLFPLTFEEYLIQKNVLKAENFKIFNNCFYENKKNINSKSVNLYPFDLKYYLFEVLIFGLYPNLINYPKDHKYLLNFTDSLIFKDLLELNLIENKKLAHNLLKLLAYQIGNLISYKELADQLEADQRTIKRYIEIFEQSFIVFRIYPFSGNLRNEIKKAPKIYFYDLGIRNALINNFSSLETRNDKGQLFENFIISECLKANEYLDKNYKINYWRTKQGSEIDLILSNSNKIQAVEIKYNRKRINQAFQSRYPQAGLSIITKDNFF
jgi:hypothetical protein